MKTILILITVAIIGAIFFYLTNWKKKSTKLEADNKNGQKRDSSINQNPTVNPYYDLRQLAFNATAEQTGRSDSIDPNKVYGIIMDWDVGDGIATLVSFEDGEASLYLSTGGGIIGGIGHETVRRAVSDYLLVGQTYFNNTSKTDTTLLPDKGCIKFYLLTSNGKFVAQEHLDNIENESSKWIPLFEKANNIITELRILPGAQ